MEVKMAKTICMASAKGGAGKTILTATFASFLTALGKKVIVIDTDASTNGLTLMYLKEVLLTEEVFIGKSKQPLGTFEFDATKHSPDYIGLVTLPNGVLFLPAAFRFTNTEAANLEQFRSTLKNLIHIYSKYADYIFLDAQAGSDNFAAVSMSRNISDQVIIVSEYDPLSAAGIERLKALFREDLNYGRTWILLNKMLPDFVQSFSSFLEVAKYLSPVPWDADVVRSYAKKKLALDMENGNDFTLSIVQTMRGLLGDEIEKEVSSWLSEKSASLREPIDIQINDLKTNLEMLQKQKLEAQKLSYRKSMFSNISNMAIVVVAFGTAVTFATKFLTKFDTTERVIVLGMVTTALIGLIISIISKSLEFRASKNELDDEKISSHMNSMISRLDKLESLRSGSIEALIKANRTS
ncbi:ParA family protein [Mucilaginibacter galii]